jgi:NAD+ diphosphatase
MDISATIPFSGSGLERCERERSSQRWLLDERDSPRARFIALHNLQIAMLPHPSLEPAYLKFSEIPVAIENDTTMLFLGQKDGKSIFAVECLNPEAEQLREVGYTFNDVRSIAMQMDGPDLAIIGHARSMMSWHLKNRFCGVCGTRTLVQRGGAVRKCGNESCAAEYYPRNDPVVIMLAHSGDQCLLGRQHRFPPKMYSALAGFLEHGESLEEAVRRELLEEAGIDVGAVEYIASQPWPFEQSIMIGCLAEATSEEISLDEEELDDARWVSLDDVRRAMTGDETAPIAVPPTMAIAHHLVKHWIKRFD